MRCVQLNCGRELPEGTKFCTYCGTRQTTLTDSPPTSPVLRPQSTAAHVTEPGGADMQVVMRAGEHVWPFPDAEGEISPDQRRPLIILDEQCVHLAHTTQRLQPQQLADRTRAILAAQNVPVDIKVVEARWFQDAHETRPRLLAALRDHPYGDIKMIMGLDYMGQWASFHLLVGSEPEPIPPRPAALLPMDVILAYAVAVIALITAFSGDQHAFFSIAAMLVSLAYAVVRTARSRKRTERAWELERTKRETEKLTERLSRTFKVDDIRLFCTAMRQVFQAVVDDLVQGGGEVVRVEGGQGGFFQGTGLGQTGPAVRRADAAQGEV